MKDVFNAVHVDILLKYSGRALQGAWRQKNWWAVNRQSQSNFHFEIHSRKGTSNEKTCSVQMKNPHC
jgi:hypothetical protein